MSNYTPGPWSLDDWNYTQAGREHVPVIRTCADAIAEALPLWNASTDRSDERIANARLIASAPELLEALRDFVFHYDGFQDIDGTPCPVLEKARAAIRKATGEPA